MRIIHKCRRCLSGILLALSPLMVTAESVSTSNAVEQAQRQITAYLDKLADLHCTETVTQQKLAINGHVEATERAQYDYLIMMNGTGDAFQLNESRVESSSAQGKRPRLPMLVTNGAATVLLVFHPYYRNSFTFDTGSEEVVNGHTAVSVHFAHIAGRRTPAALALRGREYPLELQGTAWLDSQTGEVLKVEASLLNDMSDVGLRSLQIHVDYKAGNPGKDIGQLTLPALAVVDVTTPRQRWRNTHVFDQYRGFSIDAEQDPNVKVRPNTGPDGASALGTDSPKSTEKP